MNDNNVENAAQLIHGLTFDYARSQEHGLVGDDFGFALQLAKALADAGLLAPNGLREWFTVLYKGGAYSLVVEALTVDAEKVNRDYLEDGYEISRWYETPPDRYWPVEEGDSDE